MKGYQGLARALRVETDVIFGVMGHATASALVSFIGEGGRYVSSRHEGGAVNMADGWARVAGGVGVATVTVGPGITQIGTSLVTASRGGTPLVVVAGDLPWSDPARHQHAFDQARFAQAAEALYVPVVSPSSLAEDVAEAFYLARTRRQAVVLDVAIPVQEAELPAGWSYRPAPDPSADQRVVPDPVALDALVALLQRAQRPLVLAGRGALAPDTGEALSGLAEQLGALLATTMPAKGLFDDEPWNIGVSGGYASRVAEGLFSGADVVLAFGTSLHRHATRDGALFRDAALVRVDTLSAPRMPALPGWGYLRGDAAVVATALRGRLAALGPGRPGYRTPDVAERLRAASWDGSIRELSPDGADPRALMGALATLLPRDAVIVCSGGHSAAFPVQYLAAPAGARFVFSNVFGAIGQALGMAIGAAVAARDRRVVLLDGDGSLLMQVQELDTAARESTPVVIIVMNDSAYGAEYHQLGAHGHRADSAVFAPRNFVEIARALGGDGTTVQELGQLSDAVRTGLAATGPYVIDVPISRTIVSDAYRRLHYHQASEAPHLGRALPPLADITAG